MSDLKYSKIESDRFKKIVYRMDISQDAEYDIDIHAISEDIERKNIDCCIIRLPYEQQQNANRLLCLPYNTIIGDVLVYYICHFSKHEPMELRNKDLVFEPLTLNSLEELTGLSARIFKEYRNHYSFNPILKVDISKIYSDWLQGFISLSKEDEKIGWIVRRKSKAIGVATCKFKGNKSEGVLYGVVPEAAGGGIYGDIIRFTQAYSVGKGMGEMEVSTQVGNFAVQKVWSREGFYMNRAYLTIHIYKLKN